MKVLFVCTKFPPSVGGMQKSNHEIAKAIYDINYDVSVLTIGMKENDKIFDISQEYPITRVENTQKGNYYNLIKRAKFFFQFYRALKNEINSFKPDKIVYADNFTRNILGLFPVTKNIDIITIVSVPEVNKVRDNRFLTYIRDKIAKNAYLKSDNIIYVSNSTRDSLYEYYGRDIFINKNNYIIYRTLDNKFFNKSVDKTKVTKIKDDYKIKDNEEIILSVSRIEKSKGIDYTLKALSKLDKDFNYKYIVVGDGNYLDKLKNLANELELDDRVIFVGEIDFNDVIHYYDLADVFILPSRRGTSESFGRVFAEASARGTAVIGNNTGGVKEVIKNGETGLLVDPNNIEDIKKALLKLIENEDLRNELGEEGKEQARKRFSKKMLEDSLIEILN